MNWVISELYYPEETSTGHYMTGIAEALGKDGPVKVLCARPNYSQRGVKVPRRELHHGVEIERCWSTAWDKNSFGSKLVNVLTISLSLFWLALWRLKRNDKVLVVTNPPLLPFVISIACALRRSTCFLRIDDVYPEAMICAGVIRSGGVIARALESLNRWLFRRMKRIVVLGRDMACLVEAKLERGDRRVIFIPNWADTDEVWPMKRGANPLLHEAKLTSKLIVGYAGNLGPLQAIDSIFACALLLRDEPQIHFVFIGGGKKAAWLAAAVNEIRLKNVTLFGPRPRRDQTDFLNAWDVGLITLVPGMSGVGVPSRAYNMMAAGKPIIAALDSDSEVARMVREERIGWVVPPGDPATLARAICEARDHPSRLEEMGRRAREAAETQYSYTAIVDQYRCVLRDK